jgi:hypothetical protein
MNLRIFALGMFMALLCHLTIAQSESKNKDVLIFDDTTVVIIDSVGLKKNEVKPKKQTDSIPEANKPNIDTTKLVQKSDTTSIVIKGYSPFTNYTDTFNVSSGIEKKQILRTDTINLVDSLTINPKVFRLPDSTAKYIYEYDFDYSKTSLAKTWNQYLNNETKSTKELATLSNETTHAQEVINKGGSLSSKHLVINKSVEKLENISTKTNSSSTSVEFYIQLAASRTALSDSELDFVNPNNQQLRIIEEEKWFKYQLPVGSDYLTARRKVNNYPNKNSFLVAYKGMQKLSLWETVKHIELQKPKEPELVFVIQLAASKKPLSFHEKKALGNGSDHIRVIEEDGWFKYQIVIGSSYSLAIEKLKLTGTSKSFPVAYWNGKKIEMAKALKKIR